MQTDEEARELNERAARAMGWHLVTHEDWPDAPYWTLPDGGVTDAPPWGEDHGDKRYGDFYTLPDFARDPVQSGYLVAWLMGRPEWHWKISNGGIVAEPPFDAFVTPLISPEDDVATILRKGLTLFRGKGDTPGEALCRAIVAWAESARAEAGETK